VYYQPESVVVHFEGISSGTDIKAGVKRHQATNKRKFVDKWRDALKRQPPPPPAVNQQFRHQLVVRDEFTEDDTYAY
jgi:GT2 family glycosyltransferase